MENNGKNLYIGVIEGVLRGFFMTLAILLIYAVVAHFVQIDESITSLLIIVATLLSVVYGSIYASKKSGRKGWLNGLIVAILYFAILYIVALVAQSRDAALTLKDFARLFICVFVGMLAGMLGINI
jgi:putative membrane protein (TIGR04086 family)